jgi:hypothetical protein
MVSVSLREEHVRISQFELFAKSHIKVLRSTVGGSQSHKNFKVWEGYVDKGVVSILENKALKFIKKKKIQGCEDFSHTNISLNHMGYLMPS